MAKLALLEGYRSATASTCRAPVCSCRSSVRRPPSRRRASTSGGPTGRMEDWSPTPRSPRSTPLPGTRGRTSVASVRRERRRGRRRVLGVGDLRSSGPRLPPAVPTTIPDVRHESPCGCAGSTNWRATASDLLSALKQAVGRVVRRGPVRQRRGGGREGADMTTHSTHSGPQQRGRRAENQDEPAQGEDPPTS